MTTLTPFQKAAYLLGCLNRRYNCRDEQSYAVEDGKVIHTTWETSGHNGDPYGEKSREVTKLVAQWERELARQIMAQEDRESEAAEMAARERREKQREVAIRENLYP